MCGIVGYVTAEKTFKNGTDRKKFMEQGLIIDTLRGDDSTGVFYQGRERKVGDTAGWYKMVADGYTFAQSPDFIKVNQDTHWFMVGHNRSATVGSVNLQGAHPFQEGAVTLVHNGTLRSTYALTKSQKELGVDVDSHALCHNLAMHEPGDVQKVIGKIDGAFALVWHDARDGSLNIIRNHERPLHLALADQTIYFASEAGQLQWLDERLKMGLGDIFYPEPGYLLKWTNGEVFPEMKKLELNQRPQGSVYHTGYGGSARGWWVDDDDDEGYTYQRPVTPSAAAGGTPDPKLQYPLDNRVTVGGRRRDIPEGAMNLLMECDLLPEDRLRFTPLVKRTKKAGWSMVVGHLDSLGLPAVIYHMQTMTADAAWDRRWTVRPVGIKYTTDDDTKPMVVLLLVSTVFAEGDKEKIGGEFRPRGSSYPQAKPSTEKASAVDNFVGPDGKYVSKQRWLELTATGCGHCEQTLTIDMAAEVEWLDEEVPLCRACGDAHLRFPYHMMDEGFNFGY